MFSRIYLAIFALGIALLPFTRALTIDVGAPVKLYEGIFSLAIFSFAISGLPIERRFFKAIVIPVALFLFSVLVSYIVAVYGDSRIQYNFRGGVELDGILRIFYLVMNIFVLCLSYKLAKDSPRTMIRFWLAGTAVSVAYMIYCMIALTTTGDAFNLPGIERQQLGNFGPLTVSRSGTFEEGNFGGLYFLVSMVVAALGRYPVMVFIAFVGLILTKSTSAYFGLAAAIGFYILLRRRFRALVVPAIGLLAAGVYGLFTYFNSEGKFDAGTSSGAVRMNEIMTSFEMFKEHVLFGVGLGQYGFKYYLYHWDPALDALTSSARHITNNVYAELLAETGLVGCALFGVFWWNWMSQARRVIGATPLFYATGMGIMIVWLAYPTFNIAFLWAFMGFGVAMMNRAAATLPRAAPVPTAPVPARRSDATQPIAR